METGEITEKINAPSEWVSKTNLLKLAPPTPTKNPLVTPSVNNNSSFTSLEQYKMYNKLMNEIPEQCLSVPLILNCILEEVNYIQEGKYEHLNEELLQKKNQELNDYFEQAFNKLTMSSTTSTKTDSNVKSTVAPLKTLVHEKDEVRLRTLLVGGEFGARLEKQEKDIMIANKIIQLDKSKFTEEELEEFEYDIKDRNEFYQWSNFSPQQVDRAMLLFEFEDMVNEWLENSRNKEDPEPEEAQFNDRNVREDLDRDCMLQTLQKAARLNPEILKQYYPYNDSLLVVLYTKVPPGRISTSEPWKVGSISRTFRIPFKDWFKGLQVQHSTESANENVPVPVSAAPAIAFIYEDGERESVYHEEQSTFMYPMDGSIIQVISSSSAGGGVREQRQVRVHLGEDVFGTTTTPKSNFFTGYFEDGTCCWIGREDGEVKCCIGTVEGLVVCASTSSQAILQFYPSQTQLRPSIVGSSLIELKRVIQLDGTVVRYCKDGYEEILFADGQTAMKNPQNEVIYTNNQGERSGKKKDGQEWTPPKIGVVVTTNPYNLEVQTVREDNIMISTSPSGMVTVKGADGTLITTANSEGQSKEQKITVESQSYATVELNPQHKRSICLLPNETKIDCTQGVVTITLAVGHVLKVTSNGNINFSPAKKDSSRLHTTSYTFNCDNGTMKTTDYKHNIFQVDEDGTASVSKRENTEGESIPSSDGEEDEKDETADAKDKDESTSEEKHETDESDSGLISHPPRLFVIKEDGSGYELLRESDVAKYIKRKEEQAKVSPNCFMSVEPVAGDESSFSFTFITKKRLEPKEGRANELLLCRQLIKHPSLSEEQLDELVDELEKFTEMQNKRDEGEEANLPPPPSEEKLKEIQEKIEQYQKMQAQTIKQKEEEALERLRKHEQEIEEKRRQERELLQSRASTAESDKSTPKKSSSGKAQTRTYSFEKRPATTMKYFETEEGLAFLQSVAEAGLPKRDKPSTPEPHIPKVVSVPPASPPAKLSKSQLPPLTETPPTSSQSTRESTPNVKHSDSVIQQNQIPPNTPSKRLSPIQKPKSSGGDGSHTGRKHGSSQFIHAPTALKFGTLRQGGVYRLPFMLRNVGTESGRFNVKTGSNKSLQVLYTPGPVAPGISISLEVEVKATELGTIAEDIRIDTEKDTLRVKVQATIVPPDAPAQPNHKVQIVK